MKKKGCRGTVSGRVTGPFKALVSTANYNLNLQLPPGMEGSQHRGHRLLDPPWPGFALTKRTTHALFAPILRLDSQVSGPFSSF